MLNISATTLFKAPTSPSDNSLKEYFPRVDASIWVSTFTASTKLTMPSAWMSPNPFEGGKG